ncbi:hypothetical protein L6164_015836 [Bauhinia variegata]|uniref:Uncharacterized protein n=1 Tax=Bauhinia variegata TaxID=167791 RepID=A0ACB9NS03_BAUVA|nr:hypothetical protein L6164_015836 [Bauhinia variegata]
MNIVFNPPDKRIAKDVNEKEVCQLSSETYLKAPDKNVAINEDGGVPTGSQNSSSMQYEVQQDHSQPISEPDLTNTTTNVAEKHKAKRITRYNRRGRARAVN